MITRDNLHRCGRRADDVDPAGPQVLFKLNQWNYHEGQQRYRGACNQEYYLGEFQVLEARRVDVESHRLAVGPISIIHQRSANPLAFRRSRQHIRADGTDLSVLWFVRSGWLKFSDQGGSRRAGPGDFAITRSNAPFLLECHPDQSGIHDMLHVTVPSHLLLPHLSHDLAGGFFASCDNASLAMAERLCRQVFEAGRALDEGAANVIVEAALRLVGIVVRGVPPVHRTLREARLQETLTFIERHLNNPQLSTAFVAKGCSFSQRHLSHLLRTAGTSFREVVWHARLERAVDLMLASDSKTLPLGEIAYSVGFKSPAHFSRMFKRHFGQNASDYRDAETHKLLDAGSTSEPLMWRETNDDRGSTAGAG